MINRFLLILVVLLVGVPLYAQTKKSAVVCNVESVSRVTAWRAAHLDLQLADNAETTSVVTVQCISIAKTWTLDVPDNMWPEEWAGFHETGFTFPAEVVEGKLWLIPKHYPCSRSDVCCLEAHARDALGVKVP